jgi:Abnormal spindle-like microcephaly-assoc'd, ASPM-SPD-2-Hydin/Beta-propeller repeat
MGQAEPRAQFLGRGRGIEAAFTASGIEIQTGRRAPRQGRVEPLRIEFVGARGAGIRWRAEEPLVATSNYFHGSSPSRWRSGVAHFARVATEVALDQASADSPNLMSVAVYAGDEGLEYDLQLRAGTDLARPRLKVSGADELRLDSKGDLLVQAGGREVRMKRPTTYEQRGPTKRLVDSGYVLRRDGLVGFHVGPHDPRADLLIDPQLSVTYSTFLGGAGSDSANSMALDSSGNIYIGGTTTSPAFPAPSTQQGPGGAADYFIAKLDPTQSGAKSLIYLTFLGGSGAEAGGLIAVDFKGDVAITGTTTSTDFPVTDKSTRTSGTNDVTVTELDPTGSKLLFSTLFGGNGAESTQSPGGIGLDSSGDVFIASDTTSSNLPVTPASFQDTYSSNTTDGFLAVLTPPTTAGASPAVKYCTYLGLNAQVGVSSIAVDSNGIAYLAGFTSDPGSTFTATGAFQSAYGGGAFDAFLIKINPAGTGPTDLVYGTYLGGSGMDQAFAVAVDSETPPNAYVTGSTQSPNFPVNGTLTAFQSALGPGVNVTNAFVAIIAQNPNLPCAASQPPCTSLEYSTYLGGSASDAGLSLALAATSAGTAIYVTGQTTSGNFPWHDNSQPFNGDQDAFLVKLEPNVAGLGSLIYSTPLGGTAPAGVTALAQANAVLADKSSHVYLAGSTTASDFPRAGSPQNGVQSTCSSCSQIPPASDAFLTVITENLAAMSPSVSFSLNGGGRKLVFGAQPLSSQTGLFAAVLNSGDATLTVSTLAVIGPNSADFDVSHSTCQNVALAPGTQCSFDVGFMPSVVGPEQAFIIASDDAPGNPQELELSGAGEGPLAQITPPNLNFGDVPVGKSPTLTATLKNMGAGNQSLQIVQTTLPTAPFSTFQGDTCAAGISLAVGQSCTFVVAFSPSTGSFQSTINVTDNSGDVAGAQQVIQISGSGTPPAPPSVTLVPASLIFGSESVGTATGTQTVMLTNTGGTALTFASIALTGTDAASFGMVKSPANPCPISGGSLGAGATCNIGVDFLPESAGAKSASLTFTDNATGSPQSVLLAGTGTAPSIQLSLNSINFGTEPVGVPSSLQPVTLTNNGNAPLGFSGRIATTGTNAADFTESDNCEPSVGNTPPNNFCTINITFTPTAPGNRVATLVIPDDAPGNPHTVALSGTAVQAAVSLSPANLSFGNQIGGTASTAQSVTVTNKGSVALAFTSISFMGTSPGDFSEKDTCAGAKITIAPSSTCAIQVTFTPANDGPASATMVLKDNAPDSPESVPLSGAGVDFTLGPASGSSVTATVTAGQTATYMLNIGGGSGAVPLMCSGAPTGAVCTAPATATAGTPFTVGVSTASNSTIITRRMPTIRNIMSSHRPPTLAFVLLVLSAILLAIPRRKLAARLTQCFALAVLFAVALGACGGGGGGGDPAVATGTPPGTYTINVSGTAAGVTHNVPLTLVVQ